MKNIISVIILAFLFSCSKKIITPNYIVFNTTQDSLLVFAKNTLKSPYHIRVKKDSKIVSNNLIVLPDSKTKLMGFSHRDMDSINVLKHYKFETYLGIPNSKSYDTLYNYSLPFPKQKSYVVLQGNNGVFSHYGSFSENAIDFKMPVGDTICAARNGYVVRVVEHNTKQGFDESYRDYANFITLYHEDGTYSQYVHLKKNGALVNVNQYIKQGEPIGLSGHTGWSTEPHLHFAVFKVLPFEFVSIPIIINNKKSKSLQRWDVLSH